MNDGRADISHIATLPMTIRPFLILCPLPRTVAMVFSLSLWSIT